MTDFDQIFQKYYHSLFLYGKKFINNENDVCDILQEIFMVVWENRKYKLEDVHLKSYLFNSVRNSCLNYHRHRAVVNKYKEYEVFNELNFYESGEKSLIEKEDLNNIYEAISLLKEDYKEVIELSRFEGLKNKEIAEKLNIPLRTVETRLFRALSALKKMLTQRQIFILVNMIFESD
ncbi:RNA polymerase sigma factor [Maribellus maritimus]|uniref:RNA polymerase sigma factor n=1 Tax=Maribellus maritimus TaxID=2870838 RepID=UPI001EE9E63F|nr:RNA polymerase sigma-70 factor [Maribellus maritimus]MCG6189717.1 RNA polymerase sigma-70 factor [Maribellus maritimus]